MEDSNTSFEPTNPGPLPEPPAPRGTIGEAILSALQNPASGGASVNLSSADRTGAGLIMIVMGLLLILLYIVMQISGFGFMGDVMGPLMVSFIFISLFSWLFNLLGTRMGSGEAGPAEATYGTGIFVMFLGVILFICGILVKVMTPMFMTRSPNQGTIFIAFLIIAICTGLFLMLGAVSFGIWSRLYGASESVSAWFSGIFLSLGMAMGGWITVQIYMPSF